MLAQELAVPDKARAIVWCGDRLCVGFAKEYNMISINSGIMTDIFPCKGQRPIATRLPNNEILLCRDSTARSSGRINLRKNGKLTLQFFFVCL